MRQLELFPLDTAETLRQSPPPLQASDAITAAVEPFIDYMTQREFTENTIKSFLHDLKLFIRFVGPETPLSSCSTRTLEEFIHYLKFSRKAPCSPKSLARRITTLKVFFRWLADKSILPSDIAAPLAYPEIASPLPQILSDKQVEALLEITRSMRDAPESPDARPHLLVTLILSTGIKKSECMRIALRDIDVSEPDRPVVTIRYDKPRQRFKARRLALPGEWTTTLKEYLRRYQPKERLFECTPRNLEYVLHMLSTLAHLPFMLTFEMLRWTSAVRGLKAGMDEEHLRKRLGLSRVSWQWVFPILRKLAEEPL